MALPRSSMVLCAIGTVCTVTSALRAKRTRDIEARVTSYTFDKFIEDFGRTYEVGSAEYLHRYEVFEDSMAQIVAKNALEDNSWTAGVHPFMDMTDQERMQLHGYKPSGGRKSGLISLELETNETTYGGSGDSFQVMMPPVLNQGGLCGSCWAIAATQAVEMQLMKVSNPTWDQLYGSPMRISTQSLLECAQIENPRNCGGPGGCKGSTSEVAFNYIRDHGIPLASEHPYHPNPEKLSKHCPLQPYPANWARVTIDGWRALPSNKAQPLMQALVQEGAVIVAIDSHKLYPYSSGIFDDCPKDAVVSHALLATGYGGDGGQKFWSLQNSWGPQWGEGGSVRVLRHDNEDQWCGTDHHPEEGFACDGETKPVTVCGTCGILFDMVIPSGPQVQAPSGDVSNSGAPADSDSTSLHAVNPNRGFSAWGMPPPPAVELASADAQVDGYFSTPAPDHSVNSNQGFTTASPPTQTAPPDVSAEVVPASTADAGSSDAGTVSQLPSISVPGSQPQDSPPSAPDSAVHDAPTSDLANMYQKWKEHEVASQTDIAPSALDPTVVPPNAANSPVSDAPTSDVVKAQQDVLQPSAPDSSAASYAPTSVVAKMQQTLKQDALESQMDVTPSPPDSSPTPDVAQMQQMLSQHDALPEAAAAPVATEQGHSAALPTAARMKLKDLSEPAHVASSEVKQPAVEGKALQSDSTVEDMWNQIPEAKSGADASPAAPIQQEVPVDRQAASDFEMPAPTTFADSLNKFNDQSKSPDSPDEQGSIMNAESSDPSSPPSITEGMKRIFSKEMLR